jgi:hypothetical protein
MNIRQWILNKVDKEVDVRTFMFIEISENGRETLITNVGHVRSRNDRLFGPLGAIPGITCRSFRLLRLVNGQVKIH